jgi:hypothetical protein
MREKSASTAQTVLNHRNCDFFHLDHSEHDAAVLLRIYNKLIDRDQRFEAKTVE